MCKTDLVECKEGMIRSNGGVKMKKGNGFGWPDGEDYFKLEFAMDTRADYPKSLSDFWFVNLNSEGKINQKVDE